MKTFKYLDKDSSSLAIDSCDEELLNLYDRYELSYESVEIKKGGANILRCKVYDRDKAKVIFNFIRDHHDLYRTFCPFLKDGNHYALISAHHQDIQVLDLELGKIIAATTDIFRPSDFFVPYRVKDRELEFQSRGDFGFVAGSYNSDNSSCQVAFLDLSSIETGVIIIEHKFGEHKLPSIMNLKEAIDLSSYDDENRHIQIAGVARHTL